MSLRTAARRTLAALALIAAPAAAARADYTGTVTYVGPTTDATPFNHAVGPVGETLTTPSLPRRTLSATAFSADLANQISRGRTYAGVQEFMVGAMAGTTATPEPGTVLLLGGGLVAAAGAATRRRRPTVGA